MTWSERVVEQFSLVDLYTHEESDFYDPYNTLLFELFPPSEHYQITPQFKRAEGSLDFTIWYIVHRRRVPIFFLEIAKPFRTLHNLSARAAADDQMHQSFLDFSSGHIPIGRLFGISAFGPRLCIYEYTAATRQLTPCCILPDPDFLIDTAPEGRWEFDVMEGGAKLKEVVAEVKVMAANF